MTSRLWKNGSSGFNDKRYCFKRACGQIAPSECVGGDVFFFFIINSYQVDPERADTAIVCTPTKSAHKRSLNTGVRRMQEQKKAGVPSELSGKCEEPHLVRTRPI